MSNKNIIELEMFEGMPPVDGWYFVKLVQGHIKGGLNYDVDYCRESSTSHGGGREWMNWYEHNISHYAALPNN